MSNARPRLSLVSLLFVAVSLSAFAPPEKEMGMTFVSTIADQKNSRDTFKCETTLYARYDGVTVDLNRECEKGHPTRQIQVQDSNLTYSALTDDVVVSDTDYVIVAVNKNAIKLRLDYAEKAFQQWECDNKKQFVQVPYLKPGSRDIVIPLSGGVGSTSFNISHVSFRIDVKKAWKN